MTLAFDLNNASTVEFGIGHDTNAGRRFHCIPVDRNVQDALREMTETTWRILSGMGRPERYQPAEKHSSQEYLTLPLADNLAASMRDLHQANNLPLDASALNDPSQAFAYFARLSDAQGKRLTALRRATQFKGVLKSRLVRLVTNALKLVEDPVFKLDADFDLLIDSRHVHILRPNAFEFAGQLQQAVMDAVPNNVADLQTDLGFVNFEAIGTYAAQHPRAARYIASIRSAEETQNISQSKLKALCKRTGVAVVERNGQLNVEEGHVMGFLEVLDRRRYELELVDGQPELYRAPSRQRIT